MTLPEIVADVMSSELVEFCMIEEDESLVVRVHRWRFGMVLARIWQKHHFHLNNILNQSKIARVCLLFERRRRKFPVFLTFRVKAPLAVLFLF